MQNNAGHQLEEMPALPLPTNDLGLYVDLSQNLTNLGSLLVHITYFCRKVLSQEKNNERYGPPVRYDDGRTELEFHFADDEPVVLEGVSPSDYPPREWPKTLNLL